MSRSSEAYQAQQEQENESGLDMHDCYHHHHPLEKNTKKFYCPYCGDVTDELDGIEIGVQK